MKNAVKKFQITIFNLFYALTSETLKVWIEPNNTNNLNDSNEPTDLTGSTVPNGLKNLTGSRRRLLERNQRHQFLKSSQFSAKTGRRDYCLQA